MPVTEHTPHGLKYSAVYIVNGVRVIGYDNERGKGDHRHFAGVEKPYAFISMAQLVKDFNKDVTRSSKETTMKATTMKATTMKATFKTITIKSHEQTMDEFAAICDAAIKEEKVKPEESQYSFTSFEAFRKAMTPQRFALLKVIRENQPESIKELAAITHRDMKNISEDVKILLDMDLIEMEKHGKNKAPRLHYDGFRLEVAV